MTVLSKLGNAGMTIAVTYATSAIIFAAPAHIAYKSGNATAIKLADSKVTCARHNADRMTAWITSAPTTEASRPLRLNMQFAAFPVTAPLCSVGLLNDGKPASAKDIAEAKLFAAQLDACAADQARKTVAGLPSGVGYVVGGMLFLSTPFRRINCSLRSDLEQYSPKP
jgi:hypothetical protein